MMWGSKDGFLDKVYRRSKSVHSRRYYKFGIEKFREFCKTRNYQVTQDNVYAIMDDFVAYLDSNGFKPKTIANNVSAIKRFFAYNGINLDSSQFRAIVTMPQVTKIPDVPLTIADVRTLLTKGRPTPKTRALIFTLFSSGMKIGEALTIEVGDLNLQSSPATTNIKAGYAKSRVARTAFISDEAREALKAITNGASKDRLVFEYTGDLWQREKIANVTFRKVVERAGLNAKIDNHRTHAIHFHLFRKSFLAKGSDIIGENAAYALCGHRFYTDTHHRKSERERKADYRRLMPHLVVFG